MRALRQRAMCLCVALPTALTAQSQLDNHSAASSQFFLLTSEDGSGGRAASTHYHLRASFGSGVVAHAAQSSRFVLDGGFLSAVDVSSKGRPWASAVQPCFVPLRGKAQTTVYGTELNVGSTPQVSIDGQSASIIGTPQRHAVRIRLPVLARPGWQPVTLATSAGTTTLARGIGVLPIIYTDPGVANQKPFELVFRGSKGDQILWALGFAPSAPISLGGIHHAFLINPNFLLTFAGFSIANSSGELRLKFGPQQVPGTVYAQALFVSNNPGYGPQCFSNALRASR